MTIYELQELLNESEKTMVVDDDGNYYSIDETTDLAKLKNPKFVKVSGKETLYRELFGKQRISTADFQALIEFHNQLIDYMVKNTSPASKKKFQEIAGK